ncbi:MAG: hypothetical protein JWR72_16 [Flavisolibacter sp.]|jgi:uncharacterized protein (TIGR02271 family)|nr:hypothetical protein [Flavisolibacter sp.]
MAQTVIGLFENDSDAQMAAQRLQEIGIGRDQVDISRGTGSESGVSSGSGDGENGITRFFKNLFGDSDDNADRYSRVGNSGTSIVTVHAQSSDQAERASEILDDCGAIDVDEKDVEYSSRQGYAPGSMDTDSDERGTTIPRIKEDLEVGKREVESGGVRLRSRIVERPVEESIRLRQEHVNVEREPVNRPLTNADRTAFQDRDIELTERSEVPVVNKEARVVEEVTISKDVTERNETIRDTVRNTEVDIERLDEDETRRQDRGSL